MFGYLLDIHPTLDLVADELLDFVHYEKRTGKLAVVAKDTSNEVERLVDGRRGRVRKLRTDRFTSILRRTEG